MAELGTGLGFGKVRDDEWLLGLPHQPGRRFLNRLALINEAGFVGLQNVQTQGIVCRLMEVQAKFIKEPPPA